MHNKMILAKMLLGPKILKKCDFRALKPSKCKKDCVYQKWMVIKNWSLFSGNIVPFSKAASPHLEFLKKGTDLTKQQSRFQQTSLAIKWQFIKLNRENWKSLYAQLTENVLVNN